MADLRRKYVCRSAVALVDTTFLFVPFPFSGGIGEISSAGYDRKVAGYTEFLQNSSGKYNLDRKWAFKWRFIFLCRVTIEHDFISNFIVVVSSF